MVGRGRPSFPGFPPDRAFAVPSGPRAPPDGTGRSGLVRLARWSHPIGRRPQTRPAPDAGTGPVCPLQSHRPLFPGADFDYDRRLMPGGRTGRPGALGGERPSRLACPRPWRDVDLRRFPLRPGHDDGTCIEASGGVPGDLAALVGGPRLRRRAGRGRALPQRRGDGHPRLVLAGGSREVPGGRDAARVRRPGCGHGRGVPRHRPRLRGTGICRPGAALLRADRSRRRQARAGRGLHGLHQGGRRRHGCRRCRRPRGSGSNRDPRLLDRRDHRLPPRRATPGSRRSSRSRAICRWDPRRNTRRS